MNVRYLKDFKTQQEPAEKFSYKHFFAKWPNLFKSGDLPIESRGLSPLANEAGRIGYILAWVLGVPFWILLIIFLVRGH